MTISEGAARESAERPRLERLVGQARAALYWERAWPPLAALLALGLLFLTLSWLGLWDIVPPLARMIGVGLFAAAALVALWPLTRLTLPGRGPALTRIDRVTGQAHRPATALDDRLAASSDDAFTRALWQAHRLRAEAAVPALRVGVPSPRLGLRDPRALRFLLVLVATVAFVAAGDDRTGRVLSAFRWSTPVPEAIPPRLDAWLTPPAYTGRPPVFLTGVALGPERGQAIPAPIGSVLVVRGSGGEIAVDAQGGARAVPQEVPAAGGARETRFVLDTDATVNVSGKGLEGRSWRFSVIPDNPPTIELKGPPQTTARGAFTLGYELRDDYGVVGAEARFERRPEVLAAGPPPRPLYDAPKAVLSLPQARTKAGEATTPVDLLEHPWAGATVSLVLVARDEAAQEGRSAAQTFTLPARSFSNPVARALVEQRRKLALDATARQRVQRALDALALFPEKFTPDAGIYLGLRTAFWRLASAKTDDQLRDVADYLWEMALRIEDGDLPESERELRAAEQALREALDRGASNEEIKQLTQRLREAMDKFLRELARRAPEDRNAQQPNQNSRTVRPQDLQNMLDRMEQLARRGDREAAKDMLAELRQMLDNLRNARRQQRSPQNEAMAKALDELGNMIREQSQLRDRTFRDGRVDRNDRSRQGQRGRQQQQGQQRPGNQPGDMSGLADAQKQLRERLEQLMKQLGQQGQDGDQLGEAGEAMQGAEGSLGQGDAGNAVDQQGRALEALRRGAQQLANRMMGDGDDGDPGDGATAARRGDGEEEDTDPLGRPTRSRTYDAGNTVKVPGEIDAQRARRVLEDIRRRLSEPLRPREELDYLDRLLRD